MIKYLITDVNKSTYFIHTLTQQVRETPLSSGHSLRKFTHQIASYLFSTATVDHLMNNTSNSQTFKRSSQNWNPKQKIRCYAAVCLQRAPTTNYCTDSRINSIVTKTYQGGWRAHQIRINKNDTFFHTNTHTHVHVHISSPPSQSPCHPTYIREVRVLCYPGDNTVGRLRQVPIDVGSQDWKKGFFF